MARNDKTSAIVDGILTVVITGGTIVSALALPNLMIALEKPLDAFYKKMDKRAREREVRRILSYMKQHKLITENYEHGLQITDKGRKRLTEAQFSKLQIDAPKQWDKMWRIVFYDIPEKRKSGREALIAKLKSMGFQQLQRSVLVHPFPCRRELEIVTNNFAISSFVSVVETPFIDSQSKLIDYFQKKYPKTRFK